MTGPFSRIASDRQSDDQAAHTCVQIASGSSGQAVVLPPERARMKSGLAKVKPLSNLPFDSGESTSYFATSCLQARAIPV